MGAQNRSFANSLMYVKKKLRGFDTNIHRVDASVAYRIE